MEHTKKLTWAGFWLLVFLLLGFIAYFNIIDSFFLSDDFSHLYLVKENGPFGVWTSSPAVFFRPLISLSFFVDYKLWGLEPGGYHFTNILLHSLNSFLVFLLCFLVFSKEKKIALSLASGFFFLVLPSHTESVSWISGRTDLLAAFFCLSSLGLYLVYLKHSRYLWLSLVLFCLALLSKESVIAFPIVIYLFGLHNFLERKRVNKKYIYQVLYLTFLYCLLLAFYFFLRYLALGTLIGGYGAELHLKFAVSDFFVNLLRYTQRTLLPPFAAAGALNLTFAGLAVFFLVSAVFKTVIKKDKLPPLSFIWLISFFLLLLPVINFEVSETSTSGERFSYLPSVFLAVFVVVLLDFIVSRKRYFAVIFFSIVFFYGYNLYSLNANWRKAAGVSESIVNSLKKVEKPGRLFVLNVPDSLNGAYIYRNGLYHAIRLFADENFKNLIIVSYQAIFTLKDGVKVSRKDDTYAVSLLNPDTHFSIDELVLSGKFKQDFSVENFSNRQYLLKIKNQNESDKLLFYAAGKMEQAGS